MSRSFSALSCACAISLFTSPAFATPVISELLYDASGADAGATFVELWGTPGESLDGLVLEGINGSNGAVYKSLNLSGFLPADGVLVIGDDDGGSTSIANADLIADIDLQNGPDSLVLRDASGILDALGYGSFDTGEVFAGEGSAAPDAPAGSSLARLAPWMDTDDNSADFVVLATPTPGSVPVASTVPLPGGLWLFASGLLSLLMRGRAAGG
ncbi:MAG TPA: hypothetical protein ENK05_02230 [Gammaproteobacteria bacterium]|nr:hypothetical protein [Gammaproteobacteria bacterium]